MPMEMGRKKQGTVRGRKWEVFCDVRKGDSQEQKQSPRDMAEICAKQFHVQAKSGPSPGPVSQRRPGKLLGGLGGGTHIQGGVVSAAPPPVTTLTLSVSPQLKERNARIPQVSQPNSFTESQASCPLEP